jgi:hypothetical protein
MEIRLKIWTMTFPESRRIIPVSRRIIIADESDLVVSREALNSNPRFGPIARRLSIPLTEDKHLNWANTDPVALWINRESRELALKHYPARDLGRLERLEARDNTRHPAHINFSKDVITFPCSYEYEDFLRHAELELHDDGVPRSFISSEEWPCVTRVQVTTFILTKSGFVRYPDTMRRVKSDMKRFLDQIHIFSNVRHIFIGILFEVYDTTAWDDAVQHTVALPSSPSISAAMQDLRDVGQVWFERLKMHNQSREMPSLTIERAFEISPRSCDTMIFSIEHRYRD